MLNSAPQHYNISIYQPRNPQATGYFRCVQDHFEQLEMHWQDRYASRYGFWRPYVTDVIYRYLECGDLHVGFARVRCQDCGHKYLLAYFCKRRHFCPSCHQKRVVEFGEWLCTQVLTQVPHRQWVFSLPKRLRIYFMFDRKLLAKLSRCAWNLIELFRYEVFKMLRAEGKISDAVIENLLSWRHSGFNVYCGPTIWPYNDQGLEDLARYIIRACFSQERMTYMPAKDAFDGHAKVIYRSKDGCTCKTFEALDWLAQLVTHIPNMGESRRWRDYYGYYSNKSRGMRKKAGTDDQVPALVESAVSSFAFRRNWARLIQKIYQVDPFLCPKCQGPMKVISFIEDDTLIKKYWFIYNCGIRETTTRPISIMRISPPLKPN